MQCCSALADALAAPRSDWLGTGNVEAGYDDIGVSLNKHHDCMARRTGGFVDVHRVVSR